MPAFLSSSTPLSGAYSLATNEIWRVTIPTQRIPEANHILRSLPAETRTQIASELDMFDLVAWGASCKINRLQTTAIMKTRFTAVINPLALDRAQLDATTTAMRTFQVVATGATALHALGQETTWCPGAVELCVPSSKYHDFLDFLIIILGAIRVGHNVRDSLRTGGVKSITFLFLNGYAVNLVRSATESPLLPVTRAWTTLLMNWIGPDGFGCAYPLLTSQRIGMVVDMPFGLAACGTLSLFIMRGYAFNTPRNQWPSLVSRTINCSTEPWHCPARARTFTDHGCLMCVYVLGDPAGQFLPFPPDHGEPGHVVWRLCDETVCPNRCEDNIILPRGLLAITHD